MALNFLKTLFDNFFPQHLASNSHPAGAGSLEPWNSDIHTMSHLDRVEVIRAQQRSAILTMLSSPNIKAPLVNKLSFKNENLQNRRWHLRETVAELDIGNWNSLKVKI